VLWLHTKTLAVYDVNKPSTLNMNVINNLRTSYKESSPKPVLVRKNSVIGTLAFFRIRGEAVCDWYVEV
jgi:hypothetical protein